MISIIIINYNQKDFVTQCVGSIYDTIKSYPFELIIINNSPEDDLSDLKIQYPELKIIDNQNKGFSQANNLGAKYAAGEYLLFLNADTIVKKDFCRMFIDKLCNKSFGAAGLKLYNEDGTFQLSFWKENKFINEMINKKEEREFRQRNLNFISDKERQFKDITKVDWVTGAAMIVRKDVFEAIKGFDESFFLFYEDADICKRLTDAGHEILFFPFSEIVHYKGENVNKDFSNSSYYYSKESQLYYYKKHNNFLNNSLLRFYLFFKFLFLFLITFKKVNLRICLLTLGIKKK